MKEFLTFYDKLDPDCVRRSLKACEGEGFFGEYEGKRYCVLHFPVATKKEAFENAVKRKLESKDFNYQAVWFPSNAWFGGIEIDKNVDFSSAVFNEEASFSSTKFKAEVNFNGATFNEDARFGQATFAGEVDFSSATFRKSADFSQARFDAFSNFSRCSFIGDAEFRRAVFLQIASFWPATFNSKASFFQASFRSANFRVSEFKSKAIFTFCSFGGAEFIDATFKNETDFRFSKFDGLANFVRAKFDSKTRLDQSTFEGEARFTFATFNKETDFRYTVFKDIVSFSREDEIGGFGTDATCDLRHARFEEPSRVSFHGMTLRPHWFVNTDPSKFAFIDVRWIGQLRRRYIEIEIEKLERREKLERQEAAKSRAERRKELSAYEDKASIAELEEAEAHAARIEASELTQKDPRFYRLLSIACRQLAGNAEENHRYDQASDFRFWSMELQRKEGWRARGRLTIGILHTLYRYLSGYGEEILRAFLILVAIVLFFAFLYTRVGFVEAPTTIARATASETDEVGKPQKLNKALVYSLAVITLQRPDPRPLTATAWSAVLAETIVGPVQVALLILAVRRRFMR